MSANAFSRSLAPAGPTGMAFTPKELQLIRRTVAADCTDDEFDLFISYAKALRLDPRRRQVYALVYSKNKPDKRRMSIIVGIDGFRTIADRTGCYRPDEDEPRYTEDANLKSPTNPAGIEKAAVSVWKHSQGGWHRVTAAAHWDEYAPLKEEWAEDERGKRRPTGRVTLDPTSMWARMPRLMLAKVAEALALRKAWPDDFSGVHTHEEMARAETLDLTATEIVEQAGEQDRLERIGAANGILFDFLDNAGLVPVPVGKLADRLMAFVKESAEEPATIAAFRERNRHSLREFWARAPGDALEVRKAMEAAAGEPE